MLVVFEVNGATEVVQMFLEVRATNFKSAIDTIFDGQKTESFLPKITIFGFKKCNTGFIHILEYFG